MSKSPDPIIQLLLALNQKTDSELVAWIKDLLEYDYAKPECPWEDQSLAFLRILMLWDYIPENKKEGIKWRSKAQNRLKQAFKTLCDKYKLEECMPKLTWEILVVIEGILNKEVIIEEEVKDQEFARTFCAKILGNDKLERATYRGFNVHAEAKRITERFQ